MYVIFITQKKLYELFLKTYKWFKESIISFPYTLYYMQRVCWLKSSMSLCHLLVKGNWVWVQIKGIDSPPQSLSNVIVYKSKSSLQRDFNTSGHSSHKMKLMGLWAESSCMSMSPWMLYAANLYKAVPGLGLEIYKFIRKKI